MTRQMDLRCWLPPVEKTSVELFACSNVQFVLNHFNPIFFLTYQKIFSVPLVLGSYENEIADMLGLSRKNDTRYMLHNGTEFVMWDNERPFSNLKTIHLAYLVQHKYIVQVTPQNVIVYNYDDVTRQWKRLCGYNSTIGTITLADVDVVSSTIITCSGNQVSKATFRQEQGKLGFRERRRKLGQRVVGDVELNQKDSQEEGTEVVCLTLLSKDTVNCSAFSDHLLLALNHSSTILVWNVQTLHLAMKFHTNILSPTAITAWIDNFVVADEFGGLYRCSEYSVANNNQGTWKMISTRTAETIHNMNGEAITASSNLQIILTWNVF